jgi:glycosyltransferase involved in cell wall biosynthesis
MDLAQVPTGLANPQAGKGDQEGEGAFNFLFLGRVDPDQKGLDLLIRGLARTNSRVHLILAGPDWRSGISQLKNLTRELGLGGRVRFTGTVLGQEKWELLASADAFVHPSRWEAGIPFSVLEAMAVARPLLLTAAADPQGIAQQVGATIRVHPEPDSIARGLEALATKSTDQLLAMGSAGRRLVEREFSWERTATKLLAAYEDVVAGKRPRNALP